MYDEALVDLLTVGDSIFTMYDKNAFSVPLSVIKVCENYTYVIFPEFPNCQFRIKKENIMYINCNYHVSADDVYSAGNNE